MPQVVQDLGPEAGVQQVQHGVLGAADVQVDAAVRHALARAHPVLLDLGVDQLLAVVRVQVAQLVPAGTGPVGHGVGLAAELPGPASVAQVQGDVDPVLVARQRGLGLGVGVVRVEGAGRVVLDLGQFKGQHRLGQRVGDAVLVVDDREGLAPVALAAEQPVAQPEVDGALADALARQPLGDAGLGLDDAQAVQGDGVVRGVDECRVVRGEGVLPLRGVGAAAVGGLHDAADRQLEGACEREVTGVVGGDGHDRAGAIAHQDVVGDEDGDALAVDRVGGVGADEDAGLVLGLGLTLDVGLGRGLRAVGGDGLGGGGVTAGPHLVGALGPGGRGELLHQRVLRRQHHVGGAEQGVGAGGEDGDALAVQGEVDAGTLGAADPVALLELDGLGPVQLVQVVQQPVGVGRDPHVPLAQLGLEDREVAALGAAVGGDLLVGQHGTQPRTPVHGRVGGVGQAVLPQDVGALGLAQRAPRARGARYGPLTGLELFDQLGDRAGPARLLVVVGVEDPQEDPLGPLVVVRVDRREGPALVVAQAQPAQLGGHVLDVGLGGDPGVGAGLHGVLLGGQAEGVEAQGVQDVVAGHPLEAGVDVGGDVAQRVAHVEAGAGGVREHVHDELLGPGGQGRVTGQVALGVGRLVRALGGPEVLPACLDVGRHGGRVAVRRCLRRQGGGSGVRLAHDPQSSIDRLRPRLRIPGTDSRKRKNPSHRRGRRADSDRLTCRSGLISAAR